MEKLRSFLVKHHGQFDKIMLACFALGLVLVAIALPQVPAFIKTVEAELIDHSQPKSMVSIAADVNPTEKMVVSAGVEGAMESEHHQPTIVTRDPLDGIDFSPSGVQITVEIMHDVSGTDNSPSIEISFYPGDHCEFGEGYACVYDFTSSAMKRVKMISVHSGWGGEAEAFRDYLEGTGLFQAALTEEQVKERIRSLLGAEMSVRQGEMVIEGFKLLDIIRILPSYFDAYMALPVEQALDYALEVSHIDPRILDQDLLVLETCGWKLPGDPPVAGLDYTSNAIYLVLVQVARE